MASIEVLEDNDNTTTTITTTVSPYLSPHDGPYLIPSINSASDDSSSSPLSFPSFSSALDEARLLYTTPSPEKTPYKKKYEARMILESMEKELKKRINSYECKDEQESLQESNRLLGIIYYWLGINFIETEEVSTGEIYLNRAIPFLLNNHHNNNNNNNNFNNLNKDDAKTISSFDNNPVTDYEIRHGLELTDSYNQLAILSSSRGYYKKAYNSLTRAQKLYHKLKKMREKFINNNNNDNVKRFGAAQISTMTVVNNQAPIEKKIDDNNKEEGKSDNNNNNVDGKSLDSYSLFTEKEWSVLESCHTLTLFYLAQCLQSLEKYDLSATYCLLTLNRQLHHTDFSGSVRNEWIKNAIDLSEYYHSKSLFPQSYHCLSAAQSLLPAHLFPIKKYSKNDDLTKEDELAADVAKGWGAFYLSLLKQSRNKYLLHRKIRLDEIDKEEEKSHAEEEERKEKRKKAEQEKKKNNNTGDEENVQIAITPNEENELKELEEKSERERYEKTPSATSSSSAASTPTPSSSAAINATILFKSLNLPPPPPCDFAITYSSAKEIFLKAQQWLQAAARAYRFDGWVTDYIPLIQSESLAYKLLSFYDDDIGNQCKMHKRRIDLLSPILSTLSMSAYLEFYQQISDEIAGGYMEMTELKYTQNRDRPVGLEKFSAQEKINQLALKAIEYYQLWIKTFEKKETKTEHLNDPLYMGKQITVTPETDPASFDSAYHRWYLNAHFYIARMYSKIYSNDRQTLLIFLKKSLDAYKKVIDLAKLLKAEHLYEGELAVCNEMVHLLPFKMDKIVVHGSFQE